MCRIKIGHMMCVFIFSDVCWMYVYFFLNNMVFFLVFILQYIAHRSANRKKHIDWPYPGRFSFNRTSRILVHVNKNSHVQFPYFQKLSFIKFPAQLTRISAMEHQICPPIFSRCKVGWKIFRTRTLHLTTRQLGPTQMNVRLSVTLAEFEDR